MSAYRWVVLGLLADIQAELDLIEDDLGRTRGARSNYEVGARFGRVQDLASKAASVSSRAWHGDGGIEVVMNDTTVARSEVPPEQ